MIDLNKYQIEAIKQNLPIKQVIEKACVTLKDNRKQLQLELSSLKVTAEVGFKRCKDAKSLRILSNILIPIGGIVFFLFLDYALVAYANTQLYENRGVTYFIPSFGSEIVNIFKNIQTLLIWICSIAIIVGLIIANVKVSSVRPKGTMLEAMHKYKELTSMEVEIAKEIGELEAIINASNV